MTNQKKKTGYLAVMAAAAIFFLGCETRKTVAPLFDALPSNVTGLHFANRLSFSDSFNLFKYMYFYNGAGVGAGDFNNDGKTDLFFCSNQGSNALFLNEGGLRFKDVSQQANLPDDGGWSTGVAIVDINNDGLLDIYVSRVGKFRILNSHNQFLICQGIDKNGVPHYADKAKEYGLDFSGFGTQAAFLDYDMDGDLDIFLLTHSVNESGVFRARNEFLNTYHPVNGSRLYRNDGNVFTDQTRETGINSSAIGYGLGIVVTDINIDGYPDMYIGNDFHENDYLYINQRNGVFKDESAAWVMHTSQFTMGVDAADANNDGYPEVISMDMLTSDPDVLKRSLGGDAYDIFNLKIKYGYNYQYSRNNLQYNRQNGSFTEVGLYSGVAATDWSWAPLWMDFDNDGWKDLFISNGIPKRMNDIDYINYLSDQEIQQKIRDINQGETDMALIAKFPQVKIPNKFFRNSGDFRFKDLSERIGDAPSTYSNGSVYADFDNDGDLDIVVNNVDEDALLYRNTFDDSSHSSFLSVKLEGPAVNINAVGAKVVVYANRGVRTYEKFPVRGFQSSMEIPMLIGLGHSRVDSMFLVWPDNTYQPLPTDSTRAFITVKYQKGLPVFDYRHISEFAKHTAKPMADITASTGVAYAHKENSFVEFDREPLIPHMTSTEGPALALADINGDGREDIYFGSAKGQAGVLYIQSAEGRFTPSPQAVFAKDSAFETVDACWTDVNNDGYPDLVAASGGGEYTGNDQRLAPRLYLNNGKGDFTGDPQAFAGVFVAASCVAAADFNGDGHADIFIGGRSIPGEYGRIPRSYLLQNNGQGKFADVTASAAPELSLAGLVTKAVWCDIDKDNDQDLIICSEWGTIDAFINNHGAFTRNTLFGKKGWWTFLLPCDINGDGQIDFIAGNLGLNSRLQASETEPVRLYYNDFDDNGKKEQILTYYLQGREIPFASKSELEKQIPTLRKRFIYAKDFAKASLEDIFGKEKLTGSTLLTANYFSNIALINKGNLRFTEQILPWQAQLSTYRDAVVVNANSDSLPDLLLAGNFFESNVEMGRYDGDFGTLLINKGNGKFGSEEVRGIKFGGQVRHIQKIDLSEKKHSDRKKIVNSREAYILARNNDSARVISFIQP